MSIIDIGYDLIIQGAQVTEDEFTLLRDGGCPEHWTYSEMMQVRKFLWNKEGKDCIKYKANDLACANYGRKLWLNEWKFVNSGTHADQIRMKPTLNQ